jgi:phosphatidylserine/phosphatidylglycerophosphate/cardiolipin synthase-like enzyme
MKRLWLTLLVLFSLLFQGSSFAAGTPDPLASCKVLFSPQDPVADELIDLIQKETRSIRAAVYCLMHRGISRALIDAHRRGVSVEIIVDPLSVKARSPVERMGDANLPVFVWNPKEETRRTKKGKEVKVKKPLMHDKFCIFGDRLVWTGSFNFTFDAANSNQENVVVLENRAVAARYLEEFERLKKAGCLPLGTYLAKKK